MTIQDAETVFMLGANGTGMRGLSYILYGKGKKIIASDDSADLSVDVEFSEYEVVTEKEAKQALFKSRLLIYSDAVQEDHPLRVFADAKNITSLPYQDALGELSRGYMSIAVTGTHGKSSTTAFLGHILTEAGLDPTVLVGAGVASFEGRNARVGNGEYFVTEADEYRDHFLSLDPLHSIIVNIEMDHPDFFSDIEAVKDSFNSFLETVADGGVVVTHSGVKKEYSGLSWPKTTRIVREAEWKDLVIPLAGEHMRQNAGLAIAMAEVLGVAREDAISFLATFEGLSRRMERIGVVDDTVFISDYAHHPTEIVASMSAVREMFEEAKVLVVFEAHMYERLELFVDEFASALSTADAVVIYPPFLPKGRVYGGKLKKVQELAENIRGQNVSVDVLSGKEALSDALSSKTDFDVVVAFTAGDLDKDMRIYLSGFTDK